MQISLKSSRQRQRIPCVRPNVGRPLLLTLLFAFSWPALSAETCPLPNVIFDASLPNAKNEMTKALGEHWFENLVGCGEGYINLLSAGQQTECVLPSLGRPAKVLIAGLEGPKAVIALSYVLTQKANAAETKALLSNEAFKEINIIPEPLSSFLRDEPEQSLFVSKNGRYFLRIHPGEGTQDKTMIAFYDLAAIEKNIGGLLPCVR